MNDKQAQAKAALEKRLGCALPIIEDSNDGLFTVVEGITEIIGPKGAYIVPPLRSYDEGLETAVTAHIKWEKQKRRDERDMAKARTRTTGHLNPVVSTELKCSGDVSCPCRDESEQDRRHRSLGERVAKATAA